jgi:signal transduction histidine kinase
MRFGRDSLWAAIAFAWYGLVGQVFTEASPLPLSDLINQGLFVRLFGFPVQLLRAAAAVVAAIFVIRFLRAFEVVTQQRISELQAARVEEAERREALRGELLRQVVNAQEAERQRIARDLHDATGQALTALGLGLRGISASVKDGDEAVRGLRQLETLTANSLDELRHLISDLRPPHLDDLGLSAAIRWYAKELQARADLEVQTEIAGEPADVPPPVRLAVFRIAQEALTNVLKHSQARRAWVLLSYRDGQVHLQVRDDGCGFDMAARAQTRPAWGLLGMQERAALLGGRVMVQSQPGSGTQIEVEIPYRNAEAAP